MTLRHLEIFVQVYRAQNVTHAAQTLHMTQPAVTRAIQELERHYEVRLFERMHRRLYPTPAAQQLYPQALHLLDGFARMETDLRSQGAGGLIRVGSTITLGGMVLPRLVRQFTDAYPGLEVGVTVANGSAIAAALCENRLDLAILEGQVQTPELQYEEIGSDQLCAVFAPAHPLAKFKSLTLEQLAAWPVLVREQGSTARAVLESTLTARGLPLRPAWESASGEALLEAAAQGLGVAVVPRQTAFPLVKSGRLCMREISDASLLRRWVLAWHREKYLTLPMQNFIRLCRRCTADGPQESGQ